MMSPTLAGEGPERFVRLFVEGQRENLRNILRLAPDIDDAHEIAILPSRLWGAGGRLRSCNGVNPALRRAPVEAAGVPSSPA
jgi:hypothetical protein